MKTIKFASDVSVLREAKQIASQYPKNLHDVIVGAFLAGAVFQLKVTLRRNKGVIR